MVNGGRSRILSFHLFPSEKLEKSPHFEAKDCKFGSWGSWSVCAHKKAGLVGLRLKAWRIGRWEKYGHLLVDASLPQWALILEDQVGTLIPKNGFGFFV